MSIGNGHADDVGLHLLAQPRSFHQLPMRHTVRHAFGPSWLNRLSLAFLLGSFAAPYLLAETKTIQLLGLLGALKIESNAQVIAAREGFITNTIKVGPGEAKVRAGDQVTAVVALYSLDGTLAQTQWIIRLKQAKNPGAGIPNSSLPDLIEYTNSGESFNFHSDVSYMDLETLGPIGKTARPDLQLEIKRRRIAVRTDFLRLDLTGTAKAISKARKATDKGSLSVRPQPYSAEEIKVGRQFLASSKMTADELHSFVGSLPALNQFLDIVRSTPDLQGILLQVLDKPSIVDVFRHGRRSDIDFSFLGGGTADGRNLFWSDGMATDFCVVALNLEFYQKPVLTVTLYVAPPTPPLEVSAGVVGVVAFSPTNLNKVVVVRVLSSAPGVDLAQ